MPRFPAPVVSRLPAVGTTIFTTMSRLAQECGAINLSQGFPDFNAEDVLFERVAHWMRAGHNQYAPMAGVPALREAIAVYQHATTGGIERDLKIGPALIAKYGLGAFLDKRGRCLDSPIRGLSGAIGEIFRLCRLQIHVFSGMRKEEVSHLPYHCMVVEKGLHGRKHCLIAGNTTKFNKGRRLRTKWVTTECDGFRAIQLAQEFANVIYDVLHVKPSEADGRQAVAAALEAFGGLHGLANCAGVAAGSAEVSTPPSPRTRPTQKRR